MNALEIHGLHKERNGFTLHIDELTLPGGCIMGLIGENGAGKSTTIGLILGSLQKDGGTIRVLGREDVASVKQDLGVVLDEVGFHDYLTAEKIGKIMADIFIHWDDTLYRQYLIQLSLPRDKAFKEFSTFIILWCSGMSFLSQTTSEAMPSSATFRAKSLPSKFSPFKAKNTASFSTFRLSVVTL